MDIDPSECGMMVSFDGSVDKVPVKGNMQDEEILTLARKMLNGSYVAHICRKCGCYRVHLNACTKYAVIHKNCKNCFESNIKEYDNE